MSNKPYGKVISGKEDGVAHAYDKWEAQGVDQTWTNPTPAGKRPFSDKLTTLGKAVSVTGPGTFFGKAERTLRFEPSELKGWWFNRTDIPTAMPIKVSVNDVWTTARNIVLSSGSPHNYMRMVEHIIALKAGLGIDNVMIHMDSGDLKAFNFSGLIFFELSLPINTVVFSPVITVLIISASITAFFGPIPKVPNWSSNFLSVLAKN